MLKVDNPVIIPKCLPIIFVKHYCLLVKTISDMFEYSDNLFLDFASEAYSDNKNSLFQSSFYSSPTSSISGLNNNVYSSFSGPRSIPQMPSMIDEVVSSPSIPSSPISEFSSTSSSIVLPTEYEVARVEAIHSRYNLRIFRTELNINQGYLHEILDTTAHVRSSGSIPTEFFLLNEDLSRRLDYIENVASFASSNGRTEASRATTEYMANHLKNRIQQNCLDNKLQVLRSHGINDFGNRQNSFRQLIFENGLLRRWYADWAIEHRTNLARLNSLDHVDNPRGGTARRSSLAQDYLDSRSNTESNNSSDSET